jgi:hypothetical protein
MPWQREPGRPRPFKSLVFAVPATLLVASGLLLFSSAGRDDAHITYWPALMLSETGSIVNYNGERVEQSSSLLQVLLVALLRRLFGGDVVTVGRLSAVGFGIATLVATWRFALRASGDVAALRGALFTAGSAFFVYWSFGGLESTITSFAALWVVMATCAWLHSEPAKMGTIVHLAIAIAFFALVRPEVPFVLACLVVGLAVLTHGRIRMLAGVPATVFERGVMRAAVLAGLVTLVCLATALWRWWYFGAWLPQPAAAKFHGFPEGPVRGLRYLLSCFPQDWLSTLAVVVAVPLGAMLVRRGRPGRDVLVPATLLAASYLGFIVFSGGDWMEGGRFLVPVIPLAMVFVAVAVTDLAPAPRRGVTAVVFVLQALNLVGFAARHSTGVPLMASVDLPPVADLSGHSWFERRNRVSLRDLPTAARMEAIVGRIAERHTPVVIASNQMGLVSYYTALRYRDRIRLVDMHSLTDRTVIGCEGVGLTRSWWGVNMSFAQYFGLIARCEWPRPDVAFDTTRMPPVLRRQGYVLVYEQDGLLRTNTDSLRGSVVAARQFIAVRRELVPLLEDAAPARVRFGGRQDRP